MRALETMRRQPIGELTQGDPHQRPPPVVQQELGVVAGRADGEDLIGADAQGARAQGDLEGCRAGRGRLHDDGRRLGPALAG